jgi:hypothetical protein
VGAHEYLTPLELWALKSGRLAEDPEETPPIRRGRLLEPVALDVLREERPGWVVNRGAEYFRDPAARIGATPDAFAMDPERAGTWGIVQVKSVEPSIFRKKWRDEEGEIAPPLWICCQAITEMMLTGTSWACVAALVVGHGVDVHVVDVPAHIGIWDRLRTGVASFWEMVDSGTPPDPDYGRDGAIISALAGDEDGSTVDLSGWNEAFALAAEDSRLAGEIKTASARRKAIKAEVLHRMGSASIATIGGKTFATAKTVRKKAYTVEATSYRDVRIK